jgi:hypothetical protein
LSDEIRRLPLRRVILSAFALPWEHRREVFRVTAMPLLAIIACTLAGNLADFGQARPSGLALQSRAAVLALHLLFVVGYGIATSWLAIAIHRLVLLEVPDAGARITRQDLRRLAVFFGVLAGIWVLHAVLTMLIGSGILNIFNPPRYVPTGIAPEQGLATLKLPVPGQWIINAAAFLSYWVVGRMSLMLPAIAIDRKVDLAAAWLASRSNGWRLAVVVGALPWCLGRAIDFMFRDEATGVEVGILVVLGTVLIIVEVVALSLSYWELTTPPPTPPA